MRAFISASVWLRRSAFAFARARSSCFLDAVSGDAFGEGDLEPFRGRVV